MTPRLCIGTSGFSVWYSDDLGETLERSLSDSGLYSESRVTAFSTHPGAPGTLLAGTDSGVYRLDLCTRAWTHLPSPMDSLAVWSLAQAADSPDTILAGTRPGAICRSVDGGRSWQPAQGAFPDSCAFVMRTRVTQIQFDRADPNLAWAGIEIGGVWRSADGGRSWEKASDGLLSEDIHGLTISYNGARTLFATTNKGPHVSYDDGGSWRHIPLDSPWQYTRGVAPSTDGKVLLLGNGDGPPGSTGRLLRSHDHGAHWDDARLPGALRSTVWCIATNPADPSLIFASTALGQYFRSTDGGESWTALPRQLGETRGLAWVPM